MNLYMIVIAPIMAVVTTGFVLAGSLLGANGKARIPRLISVFGAVLVLISVVAGVRLRFFSDSPHTGPAPSFAQMILGQFGWLVFSIGYFATIWTEKNQ